MRFRAILALAAITCAVPATALATDLRLQGAVPAGSGTGSGLVASGTSGSSLGAFNLVIAPGSSLQANAPALAAFERAAATWESYLSDPITVTIDADLRNLGSSSILGQASSVMLAGGHDVVRNAMVADSAAETDEGVVALLPTAAQMSFTTAPGMSYAGNIALSKANAKALGFTGLDPTIAPQQTFLLSSADLRAFDLIGWDLVSVPEPSMALLLPLSILLLGRSRRR